MKTWLIILLSVSFLACSTVEASSSDDEVQALNEASEPPAGVVFEVVESEEDALSWALPKIKSWVEKLRKRFPGLDIAMVTHGHEELALKKDAAAEYPEIHKKAQSLVKDSDVTMHACSTFAGWYGAHDQDFPDWLDMAPTGPARINDYRALGFEVIVVDR